MPNPAFVHLRLHSEFSITDGIVRIDEAVERAAADGMPALAITDLANVFGMVKFYKAARAAGVKPVIGCDAWISNESDRDKPHRLLILAQSRAGYLRLSELLTRAWLENQHRGRAEMRKSWFADGSTGLIALSGALHGEVGAALLQDAARGQRADRALHRGRAAARRRMLAPRRRDAPRAVSAQGGFRRPRGARVHRRGLRARRPAPPAQLHARELLPDSGGDEQALRRYPRSAGELGRDRKALQPRARAGEVEASRVSD